MNNRVNKYLFDMKIAMEAIHEFVADVEGGNKCVACIVWVGLR
jgi:hypothetical protein